MTTTPFAAASLDVGRVLQLTFGVIGRNIAVFALLAVCFAGVPAVIAGFAQIALAKDAAANSGWILSLVAALVKFVCAFVLQGALTHGTIADLSGRKASFAACMATGLRYALPLLGLAILSVIAFMFAFILLVVPMLMLMTAWAVTAPAVVAERRGVFESFGRSADLTRGRRWAVFGLLVLYVVASWIISWLVMIPVGALAISAPAAALSLINLVGTPIASVLQGVLGAAGGSVLYFELRRIKEGVGVEDLASIFD